MSWALEIETFLGPVKWRRAVTWVPFGAQKSWYTSAPPLLFELSVHDIYVIDSKVNVWKPAHPPSGEGLAGPWVRWVDSSSYSKENHPLPFFPLCTLYPTAAVHPTLVPSAGALGFVLNPTSLYSNNYMATLCSLCTREECGFSTCHRRLPVWFYRIMSVFLQAF